MPSSLPLQVLDHDAGEHDHFCVDGVEDAVIGEVEAIGYIGRDPGWMIYQQVSISKAWEAMFLGGAGRN